MNGCGLASTGSAGDRGCRSAPVQRGPIQVREIRRHPKIFECLNVLGALQDARRNDLVAAVLLNCRDPQFDLSPFSLQQQSAVSRDILILWADVADVANDADEPCVLRLSKDAVRMVDTVDI